MNIYESIKAAWSADETLEALLSSSRVFTGRAEDQDGKKQLDPPFAIITTFDDQETNRTSKRVFDTEYMRFVVMGIDHASARAIVDRLKFVMRTAELQSDAGYVVRVQKRGGGRNKDGGITRAWAEFEITVQSSL